jgi:hypothetical protein
MSEREEKEQGEILDEDGRDGWKKYGRGKG